jgi:hypothetical protein
MRPVTAEVGRMKSLHALEEEFGCKTVREVLVEMMYDYYAQIATMAAEESSLTLLGELLSVGFNLTQVKTRCDGK